VIAIVDVRYAGDAAKGACVLAESWTASEPAGERTVNIAHVHPYVPGSFYLRELPVLVAVLRDVSAEVVVIDGYVWLGPKRKGLSAAAESPTLAGKSAEGARYQGLGARLYDAIGTPVVGVAKTYFHGAVAEEVLRGASKKPLFVTSIGVPAARAAGWVRSMHGEHRIPTLIKRADTLTRT
jgi:deoxyribonuclease V